MTNGTEGGKTAPATITGAADPALKQKLLEAYKRMLTYQFSGTLVLVFVLAVGLLGSFFIAQNWQPPVLVVVALSGMLGAFFSALTRLYRVSELPLALISETVLELKGVHLMMYSLVPPIVGAIASVVIYVGFVSKLIGGGLFPEMACKSTANKCTEFVQVLNDYGPKEAVDYGKVLIWAFIAGFSERLVPDMLQSIVAKSQKEVGK
jgi:hypothetical protein